MAGLFGGVRASSSLFDESFTEAFTEAKSPREAAIDSIERLGCHLAKTVVEFLVEEIEQTGTGALPDSSEIIGSIITTRGNGYEIYQSNGSLRNSDCFLSSAKLEDETDNEEVEMLGGKIRMISSLSCDLDDDPPQPVRRSFNANRALTSSNFSIEESDDGFSMGTSSGTGSVVESEVSGSIIEFSDASLSHMGDFLDCQRFSVKPPTKDVKESGETTTTDKEVSKLRQSRFQRQVSETVPEMKDDEDLSMMVALSHKSGGSLSTKQFADVLQRTSTKESAILFVDISGFTKLSVALEIETLSKVINDYFERIVKIIKTHGGDILRFAGDALLAEWQTSVPNQNDLGQSTKRIIECHEYCGKEAVLMASICATKLAAELSDFPVFANSEKIATLDLHCGISFGQVIGAHIGNHERMEYIILGETIQQLGDALGLTTHGDVAASPEVLKLLEESVEFRKTFADETLPQIIACKSETFFDLREPFCLPPSENFMDLVVDKCLQWNDASLERLRCSMSRYVHPVVLCNESSNQKKKSDDIVEIYCSEAELRQVFTVFIQPEISANLTGRNAGDNGVLVQLNQLMMIVNCELDRFGGQLRQFIVDDKGLVLIANFGLRGSTYPNMIEERAMPFMANIRTLLKSELDMACKLGASYGNAYCGVVGATSRHEYAVLGPSVNLAARLMKHSENPSILVADAVREKAGIHPFVALPPVKAKGYNDPVKIFKPEDVIRKTWKDIGCEFVGREKELAIQSSFADRVISNEESAIVVVSGPYGSGKSALLARSTLQIKSTCRIRDEKCHISCHICCDDDSFRPFSIVRPIFLEILGGKKKESRRGSVEFIGRQENEENLNEAQLYVSLLRVCIEAKVPGKFIEIFGGLIFTNKLSDVGKWSDRSQKMSEWNDIAANLVQVLVHYFANYDLVLLALDDISSMDEMSWKIIQLLYEQSSNLLIKGTARSLFDMNVDPDFWEDLEVGGRFAHLELPPMDKVDIGKLGGRIMGLPSTERLNDKVTRCVHIQSGGNPFLASEIFRKLYKIENKGEWTLTGLGNLGELLLNRLDSLSPHVRLLLNVGAILGCSFDFLDIVIIMERYNKIDEQQQQLRNPECVRECLNEAVQHGILDAATTSSYDIKYTFSHRFWRENILNRTLDEWKNEMLGLIPDRRPVITCDRTSRNM